VIRFEDSSEHVLVLSSSILVVRSTRDLGVLVNSRLTVCDHVITSPLSVKLPIKTFVNCVQSLAR